MHRKGGKIVKRRIAVLCQCVLFAVIVGACQANSTNSNESTTMANSATNTPSTRVDKKAVVDDVRALLADHDKALNEKNLDALMATFSSNPNTVVLGTGSEERWVGAQEIRGAYTEIFKDYDPNTVQATCDWKTGGADDAGTMAWMAAICACKDSFQGKVREYKLNVTATVEKEDGKWRFVSLHMSNAFQPPVTK